MVCEILSVGTELLLGEILNTDGAFLARELAALGFPCYHQSTVGDNPERLREAIDKALSRSDILFLTGGLGPTCDDITKTAAAEAFGRRLVFDEATRADIAAYFERVGRPMTENNLSQCWIPEGATVFYNQWGTAPGLAIDGEVDGARRIAVLLPGPPAECEPMFTTCVRPWLEQLSDGVIRSRNLHLYGIGESGAEAILRPLMEASENPTVAPYAGEHEVRIRITARAKEEAEAERMCRETADAIRKTDVGPYVFAETDNPFAAKHAVAVTLIERFRERGWTFATAESCTAGMVGSLVGDIPGASDVFVGGVISYSNEVKRGVLGVPEEILRTWGAVSEPCAAKMAEGTKRVTGATVGVSVTGIAGPGGGTPEKPVGTVCFGVASPRGTRTVTRHFNGKNDRAKIRRLAAHYAMMLAIEETKA